jgi:hypothetical protein
VDIVRDEMERPACDNKGRLVSGVADGAVAAAAAAAAAEGPNLRSGELGTDLARRAP